MTIIKNNILIFIFFIAVSCASIFCINYAVSNYVHNEFPYEMTQNYVALKAKENISKTNDGFDFLTMYKNISVVAETDDRELIGLYDPTMKYYIGSTKFVNSEMFRYFSPEDYANKNRVGIVIYPIIEILENGFPDNSKIEDFYNINVINIFDTNSYIVENDCRVVMNLFAIEPEKIKTIYIDSENIDNIEIIKSKIEKYGYEQQHIEPPPVLKAVYSSLQLKRYVLFMFQSLVALYFLLLYVTALYSYRYAKHIYISRMCGATLGSMLKLLSRRVLLPIIFISIIPPSITSLYLWVINKNYMTFINLFDIQLFLTTSLFLVAIVTFFVIYARSKKVMR